VLASVDVYHFTCIRDLFQYATGGVLRGAEGQELIVVRAADWEEAGHFCSGCSQRRTCNACWGVDTHVLILCDRAISRKLFLVHGQVTIIFVVSVCLSVCLFVCAEFFSAVFDPISIKLGHMLYVWV